jgi:hypothetical protein
MVNNGGHMKKLMLLVLISATTVAHASSKQDWDDAICRINASEVFEIAQYRDAGMPMTEASDRAIKFMAGTGLFNMSPKVNDAMMTETLEIYRNDVVKTAKPEEIKEAFLLDCGLDQYGMRRNKKKK